MVIRELAKQTGISAPTIRYYEAIGLLPPPPRTANNYRNYQMADAERLRLIAGARSLGCSLADIEEILLVRDQGIPPCQRILDTLTDQLEKVNQRLAGLLALRETLIQLHHQGEMLPLDDILGEHCVCYLLKTHSDTGQITVKQGEYFDD